MHYPQMPDPVGWDIKVDGPNRVADDFLCTETGPITSIHFWGSWKGDTIGQVTNIEFTLYSDIPANPEDPLFPYSRPGGELWRYETWLNDPALVTVADPQEGPQGWFDPIAQPAPLVLRPDHNLFFQYNVQVDPAELFTQEAGTIYWLGIHVTVLDENNTEFGWKTSRDHWNDDAVVEDFHDTLPIDWIELRDPEQPDISLDMAFVIVPEPALTALALGLAAALFLVARRRL
jgi:hypothetical protein